MSELFLKIVNMSISASWLILAVLLLRYILKKAPKWVNILLWGIVAIRLICPFSIESALSLIPSSETIRPEIMMDRTPEITTGIPVLNSVINPIISNSFAPDPVASANPLQILIPLTALVWLLGIAALLLYTAISYWRLRRKVAAAVILRENIFRSEHVSTPFVLGIRKPRIYLPYSMAEQELDHVVAHEKAHIRRRDHWWKPLGFLLLTIHWFNPLMWIAYILLCRDIELACDERVIAELGNEQRAEYTQALVSCAVNRSTIAACPLAFGEVGVKARVKSIMNYKKPALWLVILAVILCIIAAICFLTDPVSDKLKNIEDLTLDFTIESTVAVWVSDGEYYRSIGAVSEDLLQELADIKISHAEVSKNRGEDRDRRNTLVLQTRQDAKPSLYSYLEGTYIHFDSNFTTVWVNTGVKPTLSYRVKNPKEAEKVYHFISNYNIKVPADGPAPAITTADIEQLTAKFPMYFGGVMLRKYRRCLIWKP